MAMFNKDIRDWRCQTTNQKTWKNYKMFFYQTHCAKRRAVTTIGKGEYTTEVHNIHVLLTPPQEEHRQAINNLHTIVQGMQTQSYDLEGQTHANAVLTSSNTSLIG